MLCHDVDQHVQVQAMQCEHFTRRDGVDVGVASFPTSSSQPLHAKPVKRAWNLLLLETFRIQSLACNLIFSLSAAISGQSFASSTSRLLNLLEAHNCLPAPGKKQPEGELHKKCG